MSFEKIHEKIKYKSFGKVTIGDRRNKMLDEAKNVILDKTNA